MAVVKERLAQAICERVAALAILGQGATNKEVTQQLLARMRALLRRRRWQDAVEIAYHLMMEYGASKKGALDAAEN
ncbi:MAG: hypothetical protein ACE15C_16430 [Phycisphaerae bacterium]